MTDCTQLLQQRIKTSEQNAQLERHSAISQSLTVVDGLSKLDYTSVVDSAVEVDGPVTMTCCCHNSCCAMHAAGLNPVILKVKLLEIRAVELGFKLSFFRFLGSCEFSFMLAKVMRLLYHCYLPS